MPLSIFKSSKLVTPGRYLDEHGLYLQVISPTNRSWILRYQHNGRERWMGLGPLHAFSLEEARSRARKARQLLADGIDPLQQKAEQIAERCVEAAKKAALAVTFEECAQQYLSFHEVKWTNMKHRAQFLSTLRAYAFPAFGKLPVSDVDRPLVISALRPIWITKPETANRVRGRIEAVLNFAKVHGYSAGENPARWKGNLDQVLPARSQHRKVAHHRALPFAELPDFLKLLRSREGIAARALEFAILTAARTGEVIRARWDEFDTDASIWTVPACRMKAKREHRVPLPIEAVALLQQLPREDENPYVFVGFRGSALSNMAMDSVLRRMGFKDRATTHGFRSTFRDWAGELTSFPSEVAEAALAHITGDKVERAYKRGDMLLKRRKLMQAWAGYASQTSDTKVVALKLRQSA